MDVLLQDLRQAVRQLRTHSGFTLVAVLLLALGIGANTTIFTLVNALLLRPLPHVARPHELVLVGRTMEGEGFDTFGYLDYSDLRDQSRTLAGVAAHRTVPIHVSTGGATERSRGTLVSANYFAVLGTEPAAGRFFLAEEDRAGHPASVAVISHGLWQRGYGGRRDVIGAPIRLNGHQFTVIGVTPPGFQGTDVGSLQDVFVPITMQPVMMARFGSLLEAREAVWLQIVARRRAATPLAQVRDELAALGRRLAATYPASKEGWGVAVAPGIGFDPDTRRAVTEFLRILQGAVLLVLAIACANLANLLLVRGAARRRELAVRASLGAGRARIVRQLLTESAVLALLGGLGGLAVAYWSSDLLRALPIAAGFSAGLPLTPDGRVLGFTLTVALVTGLAFGLLPALHVSRQDLAADLRTAGHAERPGAAYLRNGLVVAQIAVSLVLLVAAGLFVRTLRNAYAIDPGFAANDVLVARLDLELQGYDADRSRRFQEDLERRLSALPGVTAASLALNLPFGGGYDTRIQDEATATPDAEGYRTDRNAVTPEYFETMGIAVVRGRGFSTADRAGAPDVAIVNEAVAERLWPGADPLGKRFVQEYGGPALLVVGVARDAKYRSLFEDRRLTYYQPLAQDYHPAFVVHLRTAADPRGLVLPLERLVHTLDPDLPVYRPQTLGDRRDDSLGQQRTAATLVGTFGALALVLAAIGLYAALSYAVARRTREFGIRLALGARATDVQRQVLRQGVTLGLAGLAVGLGGAALVTRVLRSQLYEVSPTDPGSFGAVAVILLGMAALASFVPARRATRVDPMTALRVE